MSQIFYHHKTAGGDKGLNLGIKRSNVDQSFSTMRLTPSVTSSKMTRLLGLHISCNASVLYSTVTQSPVPLRYPAFKSSLQYEKEHTNS